MSTQGPQSQFTDEEIEAFNPILIKLHTRKITPQGIFNHFNGDQLICQRFKEYNEVMKPELRRIHEDAVRLREIREQQSEISQKIDTLTQLKQHYEQQVRIAEEGIVSSREDAITNVTNNVPQLSKRR